MWDAERLVKVEVRDISSEVTRAAKHQLSYGQLNGLGCRSNLSIHVGAIQVHLAPMLVNQINHITDILIEYTICGWVCDLCQVILPAH